MTSGDKTDETDISLSYVFIFIETYRFVGVFHLLRKNPRRWFKMVGALYLLISKTGINTT